MSLQGKKLQTKKSLSSKRSESKEETVEKVKAIRQKQNQWMKEREASKSSTSKNGTVRRDQVSLPEVAKPKGRPRSTGLLDGFTTPDASNRNPYSNPRRKPLYPEPKRDHSDLVSWISKADSPLSKKHRPPSAGSFHGKNQSSSRPGENNREHETSKEYVASNYRDPSAGGSSSGPTPSSSKQILHNKLRPSSRSAMHEDDTNDNQIRGHDDQFFLKNDSSVSAGNFAGKSVNKSGTLENSDGSATVNTKDLSADMLNALADTVAERLKATLQPNKPSRRNGTRDDSDSNIESHYCPLCREQMTGPRHVPLAAIPCGHTFCQACLRDCKKCPTCQTVIRSTAVNTVLQQIITDFKAQKEKERLQKLEEQARHYVEEYQSLALRCNALNGKMGDLVSKETVCCYGGKVNTKIDCKPQGQ